MRAFLRYEIGELGVATNTPTPQAYLIPAGDLIRFYFTNRFAIWSFLIRCLIGRELSMTCRLQFVKVQLDIHMIMAFVLDSHVRIKFDCA